MNNIPTDSFLRLCLKAIEQTKEEKFFSQWVAQLPLMAVKMLEYIPFNEYRDKLTGKNIDMRSNEEIIAEIESLHSQKVEG